MTKQLFAALNNIKESVNMAEASKGAVRVIAPKGKARARMISYIETGMHEKTGGMQAGKITDNVSVTFELSGKGYEPRKLDDGTEIPFRHTFYATITRTGLNEKSGLYKLFKTMNYNNKATHIAELLGDEFFLKIDHEKGIDGVVRTVAGNATNGFQIFPPTLESEDDEGNVVINKVKVADAISPYRMFLWDNPDMQQWDSLFIDGGTAEKSNNYFQNTIKAALNYEGSAIQALLESADLPAKKATKVVEEVEEDKEEVVKPAKKKAKPAPVEDDEELDLSDVD